MPLYHNEGNGKDEVWKRAEVRKTLTLRYAVCLGGEEAVLKTVVRNWLAGSNPVDGATIKERCDVNAKHRRF